VAKVSRRTGTERTWLLTGGLLGLLFAFPVLSPSVYYVSLLTSAALYGVLAMSYDLLMGYTGILSFGHALFFGVGAYGAGILMRDAGFDFFSAMAVVLALSAVLAAVIGLLSLRVKGVYFAMVTMAFAEFFHILVEKLYHITGGSDGFTRIPTPVWLGGTVQKYYVALVFAIAMYLLARRLVSSPVGSVWLAIRENETRAAMLGYDTFSYKLAVMVISGMMAALTGGLYAVVVNFAHPGFISVSTTINLLLMVVIGGVGTLSGGFIGALIVQPLGRILSSYFRAWLLVFGVVYVLIVLFFPAGILGSVRMWRLRRRRPPGAPRGPEAGPAVPTASPAGPGGAPMTPAAPRATPGAGPAAGDGGAGGP